MIRIIYRCLSEKKFVEKKWDNHLALFHFNAFKSSKAVYLNGKPLKWYNVFKNGDIIEVITTPKYFTAGAIGAAIIAAITSTTVAATSAAAIAVGTIAILGITAAVSLGASFLTKIMARGRGGAASTTDSKEYSSSSQPELKGAQNDISDGILPVAFGKTQQTPSYAQLPYRLVQDGSSTNKYRQYFIANYKNVVYSDFKLGETSVNDYSIDYLDIEQASGSSSFIGFENCKAISIDEELSYNADESINQSSNHSYNETVTATSLQYDFQLLFKNVNLSAFATKNFKSVITVRKTVDGIDITLQLETNYVINASDLTASGDDYVYNGSYTWSNGGNTLLNYIVSSSFAPTSQTRGNQTEIDNELDVILVEETITAGTFNDTVQLNASVNNYLGSMSEVINTSPENTIEIDVILSFPQGLYSLNANSGERYNRTATVEIMYKTENGSWTPISNANALYIRDINGDKQPLSSSSTTVNGAKVTVNSPSDMNVADQLFFRPIGFEVPKGKYSVRVRSADFATKTNYDIGFPNCSEMQFRVDGDIINEDILPRVNQIAFEATAYKGLSGTLKKFNYIAEAYIPIWDGTNWETTAKSSNPAAVIRYLLTDSNANPRPLDVNLIDNDSLVHYYNWCEEQGYKASGVIAESIKTLDVIDEILKNSQAAMIPLLNGKHTFVIDGDVKTPKGLFNQHNSWDFQWSPAVGRLTEAIRVSYVDNSDYIQKELTVYWYDGAVHDEIKAGTTDDDYFLVKKEVKYVNDRASVLKNAIYELETIQTKRDTFEFKCNLEALNMTLLDRIYITNSANMQNEKTGLIKSVLTNGGNITGFELYAPIEIPENAEIIIRSLDYDNEAPLVNIFDVTNSGLSEFVYIDPVAYNAQIRGAGEITGLQDKWHYDGDLFAIGTGTIYDCVVTDIIYGEDCTATVKARNYYETSST